MIFRTPIEPLSNAAAAVPDVEMTADQFESWSLSQEHYKYEWVQGKVIMMVPVSDWHNDLNRWLIMLLGGFIEERDLGVLRYDMFFRMHGQRRVPDLFFVKTEHIARLQSTALDGAADLVVEIVSPDSGSRDWRDKCLAYEAVGVGEYWVIDPSTEVIECYTLLDGHFELMSNQEGKINSTAIFGFYLRPEWLWQKPLPKVAALLREMGVVF